MELSPYWENNSYSVSQENHCFSWIPLVHYCVNRIQLQDHSPEPLNSVHALTVNFLKVYCNFILPSTSPSHNWCLKFGMHFSSPWHVQRATLTVLKLIILTLFGETYKLWSSLLCNLLYPVSVQVKEKIVSMLILFAYWKQMTLINYWREIKLSAIKQKLGCLNYQIYFYWRDMTFSSRNIHQT
jgi:hypothetical protein